MTTRVRSRFAPVLQLLVLILLALVVLVPCSGW